MNSNEKVFFNKDLYKLILSYNKCKRCGSYFTKENKMNKHFYNAYSFVSYKWMEKICHDCVCLQIHRKI